MYDLPKLALLGKCFGIKPERVKMWMNKSYRIVCSLRHLPNMSRYHIYISKSFNFVGLDPRIKKALKVQLWILVTHTIHWEHSQNYLRKIPLLHETFMPLHICLSIVEALRTPRASTQE